MVIGFALGIVLLLQTITTYRYVAGAMMMQEAERDSQRKVNTLVGAVRAAQTQDLDKIKAILEEFHEDWSQQVAWIRILDNAGMPLTSAGPAPTDRASPQEVSQRLGANIVPNRQDSPVGEVLVSLRSFRTVPFGPPPTGAQRGTSPPPPRGARGRLPQITGTNWSVEIAL